MVEKIYGKGINHKFVRFYEKYFSEVYKYIYREIQNRQIAEDIAQETFYTAYKKWKDIELHPSPWGWLLQTARYKILEMNRRVYRSAEVSLEETVQDPVDEEGKYGLLELELAALATLDEDEWILLKRYYLSGRSVKELALDEGVTENNLRVRVSRILKKLRLEFVR